MGRRRVFVFTLRVHRRWQPQTFGCGGSWERRRGRSRCRVGETAEAIELRQSGENSVLTSISVSVSESLTQVLSWVYWWNSTEVTPDAVASKVSVQLNTDFNTKGMSSDELTAVVAAWQAGAISRETMFDVLRRGEVLFDGRTNEQEAKATVKGAEGSRS